MNDTILSTNIVESTKNAFLSWLRFRNERNPRKATLKCWLDVNQKELPEGTDLDELTDAVWEVLGTW